MAAAWIGAAATGAGAGEEPRTSAYSAEALEWVVAYSARSDGSSPPGDAGGLDAYHAVAAMDWIAPIFAEALPAILEEQAPAASAFTARVGRQAARSGGLLGRYDGLMASAPLGSTARLNLVG